MECGDSCYHFGSVWNISTIGWTGREKVSFSLSKQQLDLWYFPCQTVSSLMLMLIQPFSVGSELAYRTSCWIAVTYIPRWMAYLQSLVTLHDKLYSNITQLSVRQKPTSEHLWWSAEWTFIRLSLKLIKTDHGEVISALTVQSSQLSHLHVQSLFPLYCLFKFIVHRGAHFMLPFLLPFSI